MKRLTKLSAVGVLLISVLFVYKMYVFADTNYAFSETYDNYIVSEHSWAAGPAGVKPEIVTENGNSYLKYASNGKTHGAYENIDEIDCTDAKIEIEVDLKFAPAGTEGNSQFTIGSSAPKFSSNNIDYGYTTAEPVSEGHIIAFQYAEGKSFTVNKTAVSNDFIGDWMHMKATVDFGARNIDIILTNDRGKKAEINDLDFYSENAINTIGSYYVRAAKTNGTVSVDNLTITNNLWEEEEMPVSICLSDDDSAALEALTDGHAYTVNSVTAKYADGSEVETTDFSMSVSDTKTATVSGKTITANKAGTVVVKFSFMGRVVEKVLEIKSFKPKIKLDKVAFMTNTGEKTKINVTADDNTDLITFRSDNDKVAAVDSDGNVTAVGKGDAVITITAVNSDTDDKCEEICRVSVDYNGQNPIIPPAWGLFMADGEVYEFDGVAYMYGSRDYPYGYDPDGKQGWCSPDYHVLYSTDLINWTDAGEVLSIDNIPGYSSDSGYRLWAPDVFKGQNGKYYLLSCTEWDIRKFYISESDSPTGPFINTKRIEVEGSGSGITAIDPGVLIDDDGTVYLASSNKDIYILNPEKGYAEASSRMTIPLLDSFNDTLTYVEGPSLRKRGDTYYYIFIASPKAGESTPMYMEYLYTKNIKDIDSWVYGGTIVTSYGFLDRANIHGSIFDFNGEWYVSYHRLAPGFSSYTRTECLDKVDFNEDGTIVEVKRTSSGIKGAFKIGERIQAASAVEFSGGMGDNRLTARVEKYNNYEYNITGYSYAYFDRAKQYIGYRYVDLADGADYVTASVKTTGNGAKLAVKNSPDGPVMAEISVSDTKGEWKEITESISNKLTGEQEVYFELISTPESGNVCLDWFVFSNETGEDNGYKITGSVTDGKLNVTIIDTVNDKDITAYIAEYDSNGSLVKVTLNNEARGGTEIKNHVLDMKTSVVKGFLWENIGNNMRPVTSDTLKIDVKTEEMPTIDPDPTPTVTDDPDETYMTDVVIKFTDEEGNEVKPNVTAEYSKKFRKGEIYTVPAEYQKNILIKPNGGGGMYTYYTLNKSTSELTAELEPGTTVLTLRFNGVLYDYYEDFEDYTLDLYKWHKQSDNENNPTVETDNSKYIKYATGNSTTGAYTTFEEIDTTTQKVHITADVKFTKPTGAQSNGSIGNSQFAISNTSPSFSGNNITWGIIENSSGHIIVLEYKGGKTLTINGKNLSTDFIGGWMHIEADVNFSDKSANITVTNDDGLTASFDDAKIYSSVYDDNIGSYYMRSAGAGGTVSADNISVNLTGYAGEPVPDIESVLNYKSVYAFGDSIVYGHNAPDKSFMRLIANDYAMDLNMMAKNGATIVAESGNDIISQVKKAPVTEPDFIVFDGYTNDAYEGILENMGTPQGSGATTFNNKTFCGAFEEIIYTMKQKWPNAKLVFVTIHKSAARDWDIQCALREAAIAICEEWGVEVVDVFTDATLDTRDENQMSKYIIGGNGSHPNEAGCREFYIPLVTEKLISLCE